jgi:hypothetical protein
MYDNDANNDESMVIYMMEKASVLTAGDQGEMDTRQRAFAAIMKHNFKLGILMFLCSEE